MMKNNKVSLRYCNDYDIKNVQETVDKVFEDLGGIEKYIKPKQTVLLKVNLIEKYAPEKAATTHPSVVEAIATKIKKYGAKCIIADSPAAFFNDKHVSKIYEITQMVHAANQSEAELNKNFETTTLDIPKGQRTKKIEIMDCIAKADVIINVAKMKSHSLTGYTAAVKNLYGVIPGLIKAQTHSLYPKLEDFCKFLVDVEQTLSPKIVLNFVDAIVAMEGAGPTSGTPRIVNKIIAGENAYCVDYVVQKLMNLQPENHPLMHEAVERKLMPEDMFVEVLGDKLEKSIIKDFKNIVVDSQSNSHVVPKFFQPAFRRFFQRAPIINKRKCRGCKKCYEHCPNKAITIEYDKKGGMYAKIDKSKCINCFCCQELCPFHIVKIRTPWGYKAIQRRQLRKEKQKQTKKD